MIGINKAQQPSCPVLTRHEKGSVFTWLLKIESPPIPVLFMSTCPFNEASAKFGHDHVCHRRAWELSKHMNVYMKSQRGHQRRQTLNITQWGCNTGDEWSLDHWNAFPYAELHCVGLLRVILSFSSSVPLLYDGFSEHYFFATVCHGLNCVWL